MSIKKYTRVSVIEAVEYTGNNEAEVSAFINRYCTKREDGALTFYSEKRYNVKVGYFVTKNVSKDDGKFGVFRPDAMERLFTEVIEDDESN